MNFDIKKRIDAIGQPEAIRLFFEFINKVITENKISNEDERFVLNVRNDYRKRFSVNLNSRLILYIKDGDEFGFMINQTDWIKFENVPIIKKESFEKYDPASFLVTFTFNDVIIHKKLIEKYWLISCEQYLPSQQKSQYRKYHIPELFNIALQNNLLNKYITTSMDDYTNFRQIINDFNDYIKTEDSLLNKFEIQKVYQKYVWISDAEKIIGEKDFCHYELITRDKYPNKVWIELHFDKKWKKRAKSLLNDMLGEDFFWNSDHGEELSLALKETVDFGDIDILSKLENGINLFERLFGNFVRDLSVTNVKEDFISWFVEKDGSDHNYFSQQFGGNLDRFRLEIDKYEEIYKSDFKSELFIFTLKNIKEKIEEIRKNIYSNSLGFSEYSQNNNNGRPKAILGNKNYITFLKEYEITQNSQIDTKKAQAPKIELMSVNQILYGPPGTGKTYNTINKSLSILEGKTLKEIDLEERNFLKQKFENHITKRHIVFTTFHQSMSYEDFVEGIKPHTKNENVTYSIEDGLLKQIVKSAMIEYLEVPEIKNSDESFESVYSDFVKSIKLFVGKRETVFTTKTGAEIMVVAANENAIQIKYLWSSKKKENEGQHIFSVTKEKLKKVLLEGIDPSKVKNLQAEIFPLIGHIYCELFAVYKSFYDFVISNNGEIETIQFDYADQTFQEVKEQFDLIDKEIIKNKIVQPYVLIIDEINRGNVSQIFGELITLIEDSKRLGQDESLEVTLPYSKTKFGVPPNLYIIGTMNTADRSVEALDTALRRRFCFEEILPNLEVLNGRMVGNILLRELLKVINKRIEILLSRDHTIGHSYFIDVETEADLRNIFKNNIIPLLQEYFYGDYEKIGMVLGTGFFDVTDKYDKNLFADFPSQNYPEAGILNQLTRIDDEFEIIKALEILLKKKTVTSE